PRVVGGGRPLLADGPGWRPAVLWLSRDNLSLGGTLLSCATLYPGVGHAAPSPGEQDADARGEPPAPRGRPRGTPSGPECRDSVGGAGRVVDPDRSGRRGS